MERRREGGREKLKKLLLLLLLLPGTIKREREESADAKLLEYIYSRI